MKKNNPKAFDVWWEYAGWTKAVTQDEFVGWDETLLLNYQVYTRDLYDFFDSNNIVIETMWGLPGFSPNIWCGAEITHLERQDTREEAEEAAFTYAFEIMEAELLGYHESTITTVDLKVADETIIKTGKKI